MFSKIYFNIKQLGLINSLLYRIDQWIAKFSNNKARIIRYYLIAQAVPEKSTLPPHRGKDIIIRELFDEEKTYSDLPRPQHVITERFKQNGHCLGAYKNEILIGFIWLNLDTYQEDEVRCEFVPTPNNIAAWDYDIFVEPSYRLSLAFTKLWDEANQYLHVKGKKLSMSRISAFNRTSLTSHARLGGKIVGTTTFLRIGPLQIFIGNVRPYFHLSLKSDSYPTIYVCSK
jgi:hypothetical protein